MKSWPRAMGLAAIAALVLSAAPAKADSISTLFSTGVAANGTLLPEGSVDPHYTLTTNAAGTGTSAFVTVTDGFPIPPWLANGPNSQFIEPTSGTTDNHAPGAYVYVTTFDLTGFDPGQTSITFKVAVDNNLSDVKLNGVSKGTLASGFSSFSGPVTYSSGFAAGINTLEFDTSNAGGTGGNPTGFRVEFIRTSTTLLPEPATLGLAGVGILGLLGYGWRRRATL